MTLDQRISAFAELGSILRKILDGQGPSLLKDFESTIDNQYKLNPWFTPENVRMAIRSIAEKLTTENIKKWTSMYEGLSQKYKPVNVGVIMAGNIPLVGFHDYISVLISGNILMAKTSSKDSELIKGISDILCSINSEFEKRIHLISGQLKDFDMVIATGSDNSSRYFDYYFGRYPHIIRKNRNSIALIDGSETDDEFRNLGKDIFSFFGLGCRNVSKIYLPAGFKTNAITKNWEDYSGIINHYKYANNYEYNMAVFMVNREKFTDTGFLLLKEDRALSSPVAVLNYQYYGSLKEIYIEIESQKEKIQCIVSKRDVPYGRSQYPELWDYADKTDTLDFLLKKNMSGIL